jgi:hypothetical protein
MLGDPTIDVQGAPGVLEQAPSRPKPHSGGIASGAGSETRPKGPHQPGDTDALFAEEVQSFLQEVPFGKWLELAVGATADGRGNNVTPGAP